MSNINSEQTSKRLSQDQRQAILSAYSWYKNPTSDYLTIGGYAGTGKTTVIALLRKALHQKHPKLSVSFVSYTGKASMVLKDRLKQAKAVYPQDTVGTIHSLMYHPKTGSDGTVTHWRKRKHLETDLIIVDEASMVTEKIFLDLLSYAIPVVAVGDHGQLPPIDDAFQLVDDPDIRLETIHRQAEASPIVTMATLVRQTGELPYKKFSNQAAKVRSDDFIVNDLIEQFSYADRDQLILCARNKTRIMLNNQIRTQKAIEQAEPVVGDRVICLKNSYDYPEPLYNGMIGVIQDLSPESKHHYAAEIKFPSEDILFSGTISRHQFNQPSLLTKVKGVKPQEIGERFDFGYAITVHKAQGSQAESVLIFEENAQKWMKDNYSRWLYTAITRATQSVWVVG